MYFLTTPLLCRRQGVVDRCSVSRLSERKIVVRSCLLYLRYSGRYRRFSSVRRRVVSNAFLRESVARILSFPTIVGFMRIVKRQRDGVDP
jgi:hypothetical protein